MELDVLVTRRAAHTLMQAIWDLGYVYERCKSAALIAPVQVVQVKGENYILDVLKRQYPFATSLAKHYDALQSVAQAMGEWIAYLDKKYADRWQPFGPPSIIDPRDAQRLAEDCKTWMSSLLGAYADPGTVLIRDDSIDAILPQEVLSALDDLTKSDLDDAMPRLRYLDVRVFGDEDLVKREVESMHAKA